MEGRRAEGGGRPARMLTVPFLKVGAQGKVVRARRGWTCWLGGEAVTQGLSYQAHPAQLVVKLSDGLGRPLPLASLRWTSPDLWVPHGCRTVQLARNVPVPRMRVLGRWVAFAFSRFQGPNQDRDTRLTNLLGTYEMDFGCGEVFVVEKSSQKCVWEEYCMDARKPHQGMEDFTWEGDHVLMAMDRGMPIRVHRAEDGVLVYDRRLPAAVFQPQTEMLVVRADLVLSQEGGRVARVYQLPGLERVAAVRPSAQSRLTPTADALFTREEGRGGEVVKVRYRRDGFRAAVPVPIPDAVDIASWEVTAAHELGYVLHGDLSALHVWCTRTGRGRSVPAALEDGWADLDSDMCGRLWYQ